MKTDLTKEIQAYNDIVEAGIRHGDKKRLSGIKKAIKEKNDGSLKGVNKHLHKIKWHKDKKEKEMNGGFLGSLLAAASPYIWKGAKWAGKKLATHLANKAKDRVKRKIVEKASKRSRFLGDLTREGLDEADKNITKRYHANRKKRRMRGRGHDDDSGAGFRMAGGAMETESRESHKHVQKYAVKKDRPSYFIPTQKHSYHGYNPGFLPDSSKYHPKIKATQPGTGEMNYFGYRGNGFRHSGAGFKHSGRGMYDARILTNPNIRY